MVVDTLSAVISRRPTIAAAVAAAAVLSLSACGLETKDYTEHEKSQVQGAQFSVGTVDVRDAFLTYIAGAMTSPYLEVTFVNDGPKPQAFLGVSIANATGQLSGSNPATGLPLPPGVVVRVGDPLSNPGGVSLQLTPAGTPPAIGTSVPVTFMFAGAASTTLQLPVVPPGETTQPTQVIPTVQEPAPSESGEPATE